jgi:hypothetical protein
VLPAGVLPASVLPAGVLPAGVLPAGVLPTATDPPPIALSVHQDRRAMIVAIAVLVLLIAGVALAVR